MYEVTVKVRVYAPSKEDAEDMIMDAISTSAMIMFKEMETKEVTE